jgi:hypothetical protein
MFSAGQIEIHRGIKSDTWNNVIANQAAQSVWAKNSNEEQRKCSTPQWRGLSALLPETNSKDASGATSCLPQRLNGMLPPRHDWRADI